jgi:hypothetical protein
MMDLLWLVPALPFLGALLLILFGGRLSRAMTTSIGVGSVGLNGRDLPLIDLDDICEGRVWTGEQALDHKLIDSYGDFRDAIQKAAELAELPTGPDQEIEAYTLHSPERSYRLPQPMEMAEEISRLFSSEQIREMIGRPLMMLPFKIKIR